MVEKTKEQFDFTPRLLAEYPMWGHDYKRYDYWLNQKDLYCGLVNSTSIPTLEMMQTYFSILVNLYWNWKPLISNKPKVEEFEEKVKLGTKLKRMWEGFNASGTPIHPKLIHAFIDLLNNFNKDLMEMKQLIGLGIPVKRNYSAAERIKKGMRTGDTKYILPDV